MTTANGNAPQVANNGGASKPFKIFIGYDPREDEAYEVCRYSILKRTFIPVEITPIVQSDLRVHTTL
ncbi:cadmium 2+ induced [Hibiscus trionum]|uniref:Cadmium 2+ induced n=1 Tax=Hibiscus trionum TaxID=183268 RepID=A0A9W7MXL1_HIBTR|nr:cadmium 2+ induced [Hibiscus trionum]